ncbi:26S proteasome subunit RPN7-domain-containing protein [Tuber borchii]|uniref:26S proteasome subunit RPN7-domain-containing protein n=1 Tax=Tuber borchii TaxID=42251 RepID=A0A2T6ZAD9_TUBBO|nr:26S proteasome subunit RPN7-domain-containing protein [Tuber borchii]
MLGNSLVDGYFSQARSDGVLVVNGLPKFDLDTYISGYAGRTQIDRLIHISTHSPPLAIEGLKLAIKLLKQTQDVPRFRLALDILRKLSLEDAEAAQDDAWIEKTSRKVASDTERIEADLKSYKHNLIKESIRIGHEDLGNHLYASGDLVGALKCYSRMRDFCTAPKHIVDMSMQAIKVCIEQGNYMTVQSHVVKIRNLTRGPEEEELLRPKLCVAMGLTQLAAGDFRAAARSFLDCPPTLLNTYNEVITANDVATYGGLCALASMERTQLKTEVLDNVEFRNFLELEPRMRKAITFFHTAKYSSCLSILEDSRNDFLLDIHLHRHVNRLFESIRSKGIVQYFIPFSCVTLSSMAQAFATDERTLEKELVVMIGKGALDARIDTKNRLLTAKETNLRAAVHRETLAVAQNYERLARMKLMRMNMIRSGLEVRGSKASTGQVNAGIVHGQNASWAGNSQKVGRNWGEFM